MAYGFRNIDNLIDMIMLRCSDIYVFPAEQNTEENAVHAARQIFLGFEMNRGLCLNGTPAFEDLEDIHASYANMDAVTGELLRTGIA